MIKVCIKYTRDGNATYIYYEIENERFFQLLRISCCYFIDDNAINLWQLVDEVHGINDFTHYFFDMEDIDFILYRVVNVLVSEEYFIEFDDDEIESLKVWRTT